MWFHYLYHPTCITRCLVRNTLSQNFTALDTNKNCFSTFLALHSTYTLLANLENYLHQAAVTHIPSASTSSHALFNAENFTHNFTEHPIHCIHQHMHNCLSKQSSFLRVHTQVQSTSCCQNLFQISHSFSCICCARHVSSLLLLFCIADNLHFKMA